MRRTLVAAFAVALAAVAADTVVPQFYAAEAQQLPVVKYPGMKLGGYVTRDANGIAHITGFSQWDLFFLQGYTHAQDRMFQMDYSRRQAHGTLAELLGPPALPTDVQLRVIGLSRAAERSLAAISQESFQALQAYSAGVNAWIASNPPPPEYTALELTAVQPWFPVDCIAVAKLIAFGLSFDLDTSNTVALLTYTQVGQAAGFDGVKLFYEDLYRSAPFEPFATIPTAARDAIAAAPEGLSEAFLSAQRTRAQEMLDAGVLEILKNYEAKVREIPLLSRIADGERDASSNLWAIAGRLSTTGNPIIANDPHLALDTPSTWYPVALRSATLNVTGNSFPGAPLVVQGQNERIAWGSTVNPMDVTDVYQEKVVPDAASLAGYSTVYQGRNEPLAPIRETFRANTVGNGTLNDIVVVPATGSIPPATLIVPRRNNGSVLTPDTLATGTVVSVQYTGFSATKELDALLAMCRARSVEEFRQAIQNFDVGSQNWVVADVTGNIAYFTSAELPLREDLEAGAPVGLPPWFLRNGQGGNEWIPEASPLPANQSVAFKILPYAEMPQIVNPASGWFGNGNNDPVGVTFGNNPLARKRANGGIYYLNPGYDGYRGARVGQAITAKLAAGGGKMSPADMKAIQGDNVMIDAVYFLPHIKRAYDNGRAAGANPILASIATQPLIQAAMARLEGWNGSTPTGIKEGYDPGDDPRNLLEPSAAEIKNSVAATFYAGWRSKMLANTIDGVLASFPVPGGAPRPDSFLAVSALRNIFDNFATRGGRGASGVPFFNVPGVTNPADARDIIVMKSLADGLAMFASADFNAAFGRSQNPDDYRWGKLHRKVFNHPLGVSFSIPPAGLAAPLAGLTGIPRAGGFEVIDRSDASPRGSTLNGFMFGSGPSRRYVGELTPTVIRGESALPGGISGVPGNANYANLLLDWLTNRTYQMNYAAAPGIPWR